MFRGFVLLAIAIVVGIWWWRAKYVVSPLEQHYNDLEMKQQVGNLAQGAVWVTQPVSAMLGEGWGTTMLINPTNNSYNRPGKTRFNIRFLAPSGGN
jgi:hypothetical protein